MRAYSGFGKAQGPRTGFRGRPTLEARFPSIHTLGNPVNRSKGKGRSVAAAPALLDSLSARPLGMATGSVTETTDSSPSRPGAYTSRSRTVKSRRLSSVAR
jgi:hypothetical protein